MTIEQLLLLILTVVLVAAIFYIAGSLVSRDWALNGGYAARLALTSIIAVVLIPVLMAAAGDLGLGELGLLVAFVVLVVVVRFLLVDELTVTDEWLSSIVICLLGVILVYVVNLAAHELFGLRVFSFI